MTLYQQGSVFTYSQISDENMSQGYKEERALHAKRAPLRQGQVGPRDGVASKPPRARLQRSPDAP